MEGPAEAVGGVAEIPTPRPPLTPLLPSDLVATLKDLPRHQKQEALALLVTELDPGRNPTTTVATKIGSFHVSISDSEQSAISGAPAKRVKSAVEASSGVMTNMDSQLDGGTALFLDAVRQGESAAN